MRISRIIYLSLTLIIFSSSNAYSATLGDMSPNHGYETVNCSYSPDRYFNPTSGKVALYYDPFSFKRAIWVEMKWKSDSSLTWFHDNDDSTYELDVNFYNYNWRSWAKSWGSYVYTNLPSSYLDTQVFDVLDIDNIVNIEGGEKVITVGTADADLLTKNKMYYFGGFLESDFHPTADPDSLVKLQSQRGRRVYRLCDAGWAFCSFQCEQNRNNVKIMPFQSTVYSPNPLKAPGCREFNQQNSGWWDPNPKHWVTGC